MSAMFIGGIVLFALGILISVCLHEAGHMYTAKAFGMKVTRYFVGFGPTLWSFKRGETEYGIKAIPAGGFVKIIGMTPKDDDVLPGEEKRAFWSKPLWQRTVVLVAGSATHFIIGFVLLWITAAFVGVPNAEGAPAERAQLGDVTSCVQEFDAKKVEYTTCDANAPVSPAKAAGLQSGDVVTNINGQEITSWPQMADALQKAKTNTLTMTIDRDGDKKTVTLTPIEVLRPKANAEINDAGGVDRDQLEKRYVIGVSAANSITVGALGGVGTAGEYMGLIVNGTFKALGSFPEKIPKLVTAIMGGERDPETPVSVVGASRIGGEAVDAGIWPVFFFLLASLNIFIGIFNLLPLLPLDGGHVAVAWFEKVRTWWALRRGKPDPGRVDYEKLMPVTYAVIIVFGGISLLAIMADIVNPITLVR